MSFAAIVAAAASAASSMSCPTFLNRQSSATQEAESEEAPPAEDDETLIRGSKHLYWYCTHCPDYATRIPMVRAPLFPHHVLNGQCVVINDKDQIIALSDSIDYQSSVRLPNAAPYAVLHRKHYKTHHAHLVPSVDWPWLLRYSGRRAVTTTHLHGTTRPCLLWSCHVPGCSHVIAVPGNIPLPTKASNDTESPQLVEDSLEWDKDVRKQAAQYILQRRTHLRSEHPDCSEWPVAVQYLRKNTISSEKEARKEMAKAYRSIFKEATPAVDPMPEHNGGNGEKNRAANDIHKKERELVNYEYIYDVEVLVPCDYEYNDGDSSPSTGPGRAGLATASRTDDTAKKAPPFHNIPMEAKRPRGRPRKYPIPQQQVDTGTSSGSLPKAAEIPQRKELPMEPKRSRELPKKSLVSQPGAASSLKVPFPQSDSLKKSSSKTYDRIFSAITTAPSQRSENEQKRAAEANINDSHDRKKQRVPLGYRNVDNEEMLDPTDEESDDSDESYSELSGPRRTEPSTKPSHRPSKKATLTKNVTAQVKRPRGRPQKYPVAEQQVTSGLPSRSFPKVIEIPRQEERPMEKKRSRQPNKKYPISPPKVALNSLTGPSAKVDAISSGKESPLGCWWPCSEANCPHAVQISDSSCGVPLRPNDRSTRQKEPSEMVDDRIPWSTKAQFKLRDIVHERRLHFVKCHPQVHPTRDWPMAIRSTYSCLPAGNESGMESTPPRSRDIKVPNRSRVSPRVVSIQDDLQGAAQQRGKHDSEQARGLAVTHSSALPLGSRDYAMGTQLRTLKTESKEYDANIDYRWDCPVPGCCYTTAVLRSKVHHNPPPLRSDESVDCDKPWPKPWSPYIGGVVSVHRRHFRKDHPEIGEAQYPALLRAVNEKEFTTVSKERVGRVVPSPLVSGSRYVQRSPTRMNWKWS
jgi:hypothetical protein